jgi:flagellar hook-basal body complex protein FliE
MPAPINAVSIVHSTEPVSSSGAAGKPGEFGKVLETAIEQIQNSRNDATNAVQQFLSGETEELHSTVLAAQRAELAFELGLQVRNKILQAYQEVMRMQM